jgi:molybdate transport system ATP-binding protein
MLSVDVEVKVSEFWVGARFEMGPEVWVVFGPSGAGKTTLLKALVGMIPLARGDVVLDGAVLESTTRGVRVAVHRRRVGLVFQDHALFPHMTARENIVYGRNGCDDDRLEEIVEVLELGPVLDKRVPQLSGGQRQRVAIARTLVTHPRLLLLDEPVSALESALARKVRRFLVDFCGSRRIPVLWVTHSVEEAVAVASGVVLMKDGRQIQAGPIKEILERPASDDVRQSFCEPAQNGTAHAVEGGESASRVSRRGGAGTPEDGVHSARNGAQRSGPDGPGS